MTCHGTVRERNCCLSCLSLGKRERWRRPMVVREEHTSGMSEGWRCIGGKHDGGGDSVDGCGGDGRRRMVGWDCVRGGRKRRPQFLMFVWKEKYKFARRFYLSVENGRLDGHTTHARCCYPPHQAGQMNNGRSVTTPLVDRRQWHPNLNLAALRLFSI